MHLNVDLYFTINRVYILLDFELIFYEKLYFTINKSINESRNI